jgi:hypothetical protein
MTPAGTSPAWADWLVAEGLWWSSCYLWKQVGFQWDWFCGLKESYTLRDWHSTLQKVSSYSFLEMKTIGKLFCLAWRTASTTFFSACACGRVNCALSSLTLGRWVPYIEGYLTMSCFISNFFFIIVLGFNLLGRCSTAWAIPPALFCSDDFGDRVSHLFKPAWTEILLF